MRINTNAQQVARRVSRLRRALDKATERGLRDAVVAIDREQTENLRGGSAEPGSYPVPQRRGNLLRSTFWELPNPRLAVAGNNAAYAKAIHDGEGRHAKYGARPFLNQAVEKVQPARVMAISYRRELRRILGVA